jgi:phospholipid/cholesterol/gamma-HCH transport system permease protein
MRPADFEIAATGDVVRLRLRGDWTTAGLGRAPARLDAALAGASRIELELDELGRLDTAGALTIVQASRCGIPADAWSDRPEAGRIYAMVERLERHGGRPAPKPDPITRSFAKIGHGVVDAGHEAMLSLAFLGRLIVAIGATLRRPGRIRWPAWVSQTERAGLDALPIVVVTSFFIGAVVAFIGADLLAEFGAAVFTVELIAVSVLREFAVVITAVLLAGRSASAFAAEVGSMRMNQEVDAMRVMGVDPFQALVIPRLAALLVMLPLLTFAAMVAGLFGGMVVGWTQLNLGPAFFLERIAQMPDVANHLVVGLSKAPVFAIVVAAIGCRQGMAVAGDVESLGRRVTAAVVQAIFAIILLDAVFALLFLELNY